MMQNYKSYKKMVCGAAKNYLKKKIFCSRPVETPKISPTVHMKTKVFVYKY